MHFVFQIPKCCKGFYGPDCNQCPGGFLNPCSGNGQVMRAEAYFSQRLRLTCVVVVQLFIGLFSTPWTAACQASLSFTISWNLLRLMSIEAVMPSNHLILCRPLCSCPQSFPASGSFLMSQLFASGGQNIGASASVSILPMNVQG